MALKLDSIAVSETKETEGVWIDAPGLPGVRLKVRPIRSPAYETAMSLEIQRLARRYGEDAPVEETIASAGKLLAEHILCDWEGFDKPYTAAEALDIMKQPRFRRLRESVEQAARLAEKPEFEFIEAAVKN